MAKVRTRFAPSPTGYMHIGNLRTALYEYLIAKHDGGDFILRIEDTDQEREVAGATDMIYNVMNQTGLSYDEGPDKPGEVGPYIKSQRLAIYKEYADRLVELGGAHYCFCDEETINKAREESENEELGYIDPCKNLSLEEARQRIANGETYVVRQTIPNTGITSFEDEVYGHIEVENAGLSEGVLLKSDGYPTYNFANIVDDHLMNITHVVRGNEYLSSTPKYNLIYQAFGWDVPTYIHCPPVMKDEKHKLSKRNGDASYQDLIKKGFLNEAILNYIALLGWSPEGEKEIFTLEELVKEFDVKRISKSGAIFDMNKLKWINSQYMKQLSTKQLVDLCRPFLEEAYDLSDKTDQWVEQLVEVHKDHISYGEEIVEQVKLFFEDDIHLDQEALDFMKDEAIPHTLEVFKAKLSEVPETEFSQDNIFACIKATQKEAKARGKMLYMPIRIATTGIMHGPDLAASIMLLGKEKVLKRL